MNVLVGAINQEKALVGAFSVIVQPVVEPMEHYTALFRMRSASHEVLVAPDPQFLMIVLQKSCPQQED